MHPRLPNAYEQGNQACPQDDLLRRRGRRRMRHAHELGARGLQVIDSGGNGHCLFLSVIASILRADFIASRKLSPSPPQSE